MPLDRNSIMNGAYSGLAKAGAHLFLKIAEKLDGGSYPDEIRKSMSLSPVMQEGNTAHIDISFDLDTAPMARAFEFGSGEHATIGAAEKYTIEPNEAPVLAFDPEKWPGFEYPVVPGKKMIGLSPTSGKFLLRAVEHPGIEARPFVSPTVAEQRKELARMIGKEFLARIKTTSRVIILGSK